MIIIYITVPKIAEAKSIAKNLLEQRLIACANFVNSDAMYEWKGKMEEKKEVIAILKAPKNNWHAIQEEVASNHSHAIPCIIKIDVEANKGYEDWVNSI